MLLITLILSILLGTLLLLYQWCQFRPAGGTPNVNIVDDSEHFYDFLAGHKTCQIWAFNFTMPHSLHDFTRGVSANIGALGNEWHSSESFRFLLVAYANIFILVLIYAYVFLKNLNQYMEERRKARTNPTSGNRKRNNHRVVWSSTAAGTAANNRANPSYVKLPTPEG